MLGREPRFAPGCRYCARAGHSLASEEKRGGCGAQLPIITVDGMKMVVEFKTTKKKTDEQVCPTLLLHVHMCYTSTDGDKKSFGPPSYGEIYRGRPAGPPDRL